VIVTTPTTTKFLGIVIKLDFLAKYIYFTMGMVLVSISYHSRSLKMWNIL